MLCLGFLGTTIGITRMGLAIGSGTAKLAPIGDVAYPAGAALAKGLAVAMTPGSYALIIVFILSIATGIVQYRMKSAVRGLRNCPSPEISDTSPKAALYFYILGAERSDSGSISR